MEIAELDIGSKRCTALGRCVLAVLSRRAEGWCVYVGAVAGKSHDVEGQEVAKHGSKQSETIARAIVSQIGFEPGDLPYIR